MAFLTRYDRVVVTSPVGSKSLTRQSEAESCSIENILRLYSNGLSVPPTRPVVYGDVSDTPDDLLEAYNVIDRAHEAFDALPSNVRDRFRNSPIDFLRFVGDPKNRDEAKKLGILRENVNLDTNNPPSVTPPEVAPVGDGPTST